MLLTRRLVTWGLGFVGVLLASPASARPLACPPARYLISDNVLVSGPNAPLIDELYLRHINGVLVATMRSGGCPIAGAKMKQRRRFTKVTVKFSACAEVDGKVVVKAKIPAGDCSTMTGIVKVPKAALKGDRRRRFTGTLGPNFGGPGSMVVDSGGGTYTNGNDDTRVTVPPGAFIGDQTATVSVTAVSGADVTTIQELFGVHLPAGLNLVKQLQVVLGRRNPTPRSAVTASIPDNGQALGGTLIHVLIEPTFPDGVTDTRLPRMLYDGEVTQAAGRYEMHIAPPNFASAPGLSAVVQVPSGISPCFIDGVVRDSNGAPAPFAIVSVSTFAGLEARANDAGFYRAIVASGANTVTAIADGNTGSTTFSCDPGSAPRVSGVNVVVDVPADTAVPVIDITDPAANETIDATVRTIQGTVSDPSVDRVTVVSQTGDFPNRFIQMAAVAGGAFSATVILSPGRENTVVVLGTSADSKLTGSDSVVIGVTGAAGEDVRFTMTWDTNQTDVDLHVRTPGPNGIADTVDGATIYFLNPAADGGVLDVDDTNGFGPENIVFPIGTAAVGTYAFAAHYWNGAPQATAVTVSVFINGFLRGSFTKVLRVDDAATPLAGRNPSAVFNIGTVTLPGGELGPPVDQSVFIDGPS